MFQGVSSVCEVYLPAAQHDELSQDFRLLPFVEQHNARGQEARGQISLMIKLLWS